MGAIWSVLSSHRWPAGEQHDLAQPGGRLGGGRATLPGDALRVHRVKVEPDVVHGLAVAQRRLVPRLVIQPGQVLDQRRPLGVHQRPHVRHADTLTEATDIDREQNCPRLL